MLMIAECRRTSRPVPPHASVEETLLSRVWFICKRLGVISENVQHSTHFGMKFVDSRAASNFVQPPLAGLAWAHRCGRHRHRSSCVGRHQSCSSGIKHNRNHIKRDKSKLIGTKRIRLTKRISRIKRTRRNKTNNNNGPSGIKYIGQIHRMYCIMCHLSVNS